MIIPAFILAAMASPPYECRMDGNGYCTDPLVRLRLSYEDPDPIVRINAAIGDVVSLELPPHVALRADPSLGNEAIFQVKVQTRAGEDSEEHVSASGGLVPHGEESITLLLWSHAPDEQAGRIDLSDLVGQQSNLHLFLDGKVTVTVNLQVGETGSSVQRLVFDFPQRGEERSYVQSMLKEERRALYGEHKNKLEKVNKLVEDGSLRRNAQGLMKRIHCEDFARNAETELLIVRAHKICRIGDDVFIHFDIHNRARDLFALKSVQVRPGDSDDASSKTIENALLELKGDSSVLLGFNGKAEGTVAFKIDESAPPSRRYTLRIEEDGGKKRVVNVSNVSF